MLSGKGAGARAVRDAHREYRQLRAVPGTETASGVPEEAKKPVPGTEKAPGVPAKVKGLWRGSILLQAALRGEKIFKYLRRYEDRY